MRKPSMFSKDYKKEIKKRKMKIALLIILPIIGLIILLTTDLNGLKNKGISITKGINSILLNKSKDKKDKEVNTVEVKNKPEVVKPQTNTTKPKVPKAAVVKNRNFDVSLSDGQKITIEYVMSGTEKNIKGVIDPSNISYDISPSKKAIVIQSKNNQDLLYIDANKVFKDITKKTHKSTKGDIYPKEQLLDSNKAYLWSITPKFIDEDNIAYVSELPWINDKKVQYIWKVNLKSNVHMQVKPASGKNITFRNITPKGLEALIDGSIKYVTSTGEVIE